DLYKRQDLHFAIQDAFEWDADHLYSFYLRGKAYDEEYEISGPEGDPIFGALYEEVMQALEDEEAEDEDVDTAPDDESEAGEDDEGLDATSAVIGSLGLSRGHTMLYLFDFGDGHEFDVTLVEIQPRAEPGDYPRLLAAEGEAPPQYPSDEEWDDGEEWDGDEEWDEDE
ncbi:MAG: plasmid pRiA4b ORF-3 family protein, partial [Chloroflexaceae bacterium]|nr:plasmid pRiA4b ORF-3 family protein [Chloroflexaceae bacterium]